MLCRRSIEPREGYWTLPAGFLENGETTAQGALRETQEEANADAEVIEYEIHVQNNNESESIPQNVKVSVVSKDVYTIVIKSEPTLIDTFRSTGWTAGEWPVIVRF